MTTDSFVTFPRTSLLDALAIIGKVVERHTIIPVLTGTKTVGKRGGDVWMTATDLDREIMVRVEGAITRHNFDFTLPAHKLRDILSRAPKASTVTMVNSDDSVAIKCGRFELALQQVDGRDEFPFMTVDEALQVNTYTMPAKAIHESLERVEFAISTEETRYYLNGILWTSNRDTLITVATDGHRLARFRRPVAKLPDLKRGIAKFHEQGYIVPRATVYLLLDLLRKRDGDVTITHHGAAKMRFDMGDVVVLSKLIDGAFPDYGRVIPVGNDKIVRLDREEAIEAIKSVSTIATDKKQYAVKVSLNGETTFSMKSDLGKTKMTIPGKMVGPAKEMEIGFNHWYLTEAFTKMEGDDLNLIVADSGSPALIECDKVPEMTIVLMPMRV